MPKKNQNNFRRAVKLSLNYATPKKRRAIKALLESYRSAVRFYLNQIWSHNGSWNAKTLATLPSSRLSERYKSQALKQAFDTALATRKSASALGVTASCPAFNGSAILDGKFITIEEGKKSFDLVIKLSSLHKNHRLVIPTRKTKVLNKWLEKPGAKLIQGCCLSEDSVIIWVELPLALKEPKEGFALGIDLGMNKLVSTSDKKFLGRGFKAISKKIRRKKPGSHGKHRALKERDNYINQVINQLPWKELSVLGVENLKGMKKGKKNRNKSFRKAIAPWVYQRVLKQVGYKAQENRVHLVEVPPAYTSRKCPLCNTSKKENRKGEGFKCVSCSYTSDADHVGALNVLDRTLATIGSLESPMLMKLL